jgi:hypothetical protein
LFLDVLIGLSSILGMYLAIVTESLEIVGIMLVAVFVLDNFILKPFFSYFISLVIFN